MILDIRSINKVYTGGAQGREISALDNVSLSIDKGEVLAVCGPSGSGKSTLARVIAGLVEFDSGSFSIGDRMVRAGEPYDRSLFGQVGMIFQQHNLFPHLTVWENVTLALRHVRKVSDVEAMQIAEDHLRQVNMLDWGAAYPATLSGGEAQRVAIARALAMDPLLLLLDEPTAHLDPLLLGEVYGLIENLRERGTTMLMISHNIRFAESIGSSFGLLVDGALSVSGSADIFDPIRSKWS